MGSNLRRAKQRVKYLLRLLHHYRSNNPCNIGRRAVDKHPVFVIHVDYPLLSTYDITTYRDAVPEHKGVSACLHAAQDDFY